MQKYVSLRCEYYTLVRASKYSFGIYEILHIPYLLKKLVAKTGKYRDNKLGNG